MSWSERHGVENIASRFSRRQWRRFDTSLKWHVQTPGSRAGRHTQRGRSGRAQERELTGENTGRWPRIGHECRRRRCDGRKRPFMANMRRGSMTENGGGSNRDTVRDHHIQGRRDWRDQTGSSASNSSSTAAATTTTLGRNGGELTGAGTPQEIEPFGLLFLGTRGATRGFPPLFGIILLLGLELEG